MSVFFIAVAGIRTGVNLPGSPVLAAFQAGLEEVEDDTVGIGVAGLPVASQVKAYRPSVPCDGFDVKLGSDVGNEQQPVGGIGTHSESVHKPEGIHSAHSDKELLVNRI